MYHNTRKVEPRARRAPRVPGTVKHKAKRFRFYVLNVTHRVIPNAWRTDRVYADKTIESLVVEINVEGIAGDLRAYFTHRVPFNRITSAEYLRDEFEETEFSVEGFGLCKTLLHTSASFDILAFEKVKTSKNGNPYLQLSKVRRYEEPYKE